MSILNIFMFCVLIFVVLIQMVQFCKFEEQRRIISEITSDMTSHIDKISPVLLKYECLYDEILRDNNRYTALKHQISKLECLKDNLTNQEIVLRNDCQRLDSERDSLKDINRELKMANNDLCSESKYVRNIIDNRKETIERMNEKIDSLQSVITGLELDLKQLPVEEIHYLSNKIECLDLSSSVVFALHYQGVIYIGDLINIGESKLLEIKGVGQTSIDRIKRRLQENDAYFGMEAYRINNRWFRKLIGSNTEE